jgi:RNA polymerase sigma-70 factor (ECF subfamily)
MDQLDRSGGRVDLAAEALALGRALAELMPDEPECLGLLGLLLATRSRSATRVDEAGRPVLLADADRSQWDADMAADAVSVTERALRLGRPGPFQLQAAISCLHAVATSVDTTDWPQIVELYRMLEQRSPSAPVRLNRAIAEAEVSGPAAALALLDSVEGADGWHLLHAARADLLTRAGRSAEAIDALRLAVSLAPSDVDRTLLAERLATLTTRT